MINWPVDQPTLTSDFANIALVLRPLRESDIDAIYLACQDPTIPAFTRVPSPYDREMAEEFVRNCEFSYRAHQGLVFAVEVDGVFGGTIGLHGIQLTDHCAEIGYWIEAPQRGKGICTAAVRMVLELALNVMKFRRIEGLADIKNPASQRVMERAGMNRDALLRNRVTRPSGDQIDMVLFSAIND